MANCNHPNNPGCLKCPTPIRWFNVHGEKDDGSWEHLTTMTINLVTSSGATKLFDADRQAGMSWGFLTEARNGVECTTLVGQQPLTELFYYYLADWGYEEPYTCNFKEKRTIVDNEVLFLDLRYDILVRKETTQTYDLDEDSELSTLWNNYGAVVRVHKIRPGDLEVESTEKIFVNEVEIDTKRSEYVSEIHWTFAVPALGGLPQANSETDGVNDEYYIWTEHKDEDGGYDLYYPEWVRGLSAFAEPFDVANRDRHRAIAGIVPYDREPSSGPLTSFNDLVASPTKIAGSWAVSPKSPDGGSNYRAYSTLKLDGSTAVTTLEPPGEALKLFGGSKCIFPITPL